MGQQFGPPIEKGAYMEGRADLYRFFALEATLVITAAMLRYERWQSLWSFLKYPYSVHPEHHNADSTDITAFDTYIGSMDEHRNNRMRTNRVSLTADMLKERCSAEHTPFQELMQADVFLALYGAVHANRSKADGRLRFWGPRTTVYRSESQRLPLFLKAVDVDIRNGVRTALGVSDASDMATRVEAARPLLDDFKQLSLGRFPRFNFVEATNLQVLVK